MSGCDSQAGMGGLIALPSVLKRTRPCLGCGSAFPVNPCHVEGHAFCSPGCRARWHRVNPRQRALPLDPEPAPVPPVVDQTVPKQERPKLSRMSRAILERVERGPAKASELHAMFPGARSVRTRISDVGRHVGAAWRSAPVKGIVGEWVYWIEEANP